MSFFPTTEASNPERYELPEKQPARRRVEDINVVPRHTSQRSKKSQDYTDDDEDYSEKDIPKENTEMEAGQADDADYDSSASRKKARKSKRRERESRLKGQKIDADLGALTERRVKFMLDYCDLFTRKLSDDQVYQIDQRFRDLFPLLHYVPYTSGFLQDYHESTPERHVYLLCGLLYYVNLALRASLKVYYTVDDGELDTFVKRNLGASPMEEICSEIIKHSNSLERPNNDDVALAERAFGQYAERVKSMLSDYTSFLKYLKE